MAEETNKTPTVRNYLLGRVTESEAEKIESRYFALPQGVDEVWESFGDLAEEYLNGALPEVESRLFEARLRTSSAFRDLFENEKALFGYSADTTKGLASQDESHPVESNDRERSQLSGSKFINLWSLGFASLFAVFAIMLWFALKSRFPIQPLSPSSTQQTNASKNPSPDKIEPSKPQQGPPQPESPANDTLAGGGKSPKPVAGVANPGMTATFLFSAAPVRDGQPDLVMKISPQTVFLRLEFELSGDDCPLFSAGLKTESDQTLQRWTKLRPRHDQSTPRVSMRVRADLLKNETYAVTLECAPEHETSISSQQYHFRVERESLR